MGDYIVHMCVTRERERDRERQRQRQRERENERQKDRQIGREKERMRQRIVGVHTESAYRSPQGKVRGRQTHTPERKTDSQTEIQRNRHTQTEGERKSEKVVCV